MADLLILHGALGSSAQFDGLRAMLIDHFTVHIFDFDGHGRSLTKLPFRIEHFADQAVAYMEQLEVERTAIFGYSMGGYVAMHLAATRPNLVERVMTLGTKFQWSPEVAMREGRMLEPSTIESKVPHFARVLEARHVAIGWERVVNETREMMQALGAKPLIGDDELRAIRQPVRIAVGDRDATVTVEESAATARLLQRGELDVLPATPHPIEKVSVERLAGSVIDFVGG